MKLKVQPGGPLMERARFLLAALAVAGLIAMFAGQTGAREATTPATAELLPGLAGPEIPPCLDSFVLVLKETDGPWFRREVGRWIFYARPARPASRASADRYAVPGRVPPDLGRNGFKLVQLSDGVWSYRHVGGWEFFARPQGTWDGANCPLMEYGTMPPANFGVASHRLEAEPSGVIVTNSDKLAHLALGSSPSTSAGAGACTQCPDSTRCPHLPKIGPTVEVGNLWVPALIVGVAILGRGLLNRSK